MARSRRFQAETITDVDYLEELTLLANTSTQTESVQLKPEQAARDIGLDVNVNKTKYMCFKREGNISTLCNDHLNLVDKLTYLSSSV